MYPWQFSIKWDKPKTHRHNQQETAAIFLMFLSVLLSLATLAVFTSASKTNSAAVSLTVNASSVITKNFQGFGTALSWWGFVAGGSPQENQFADLFYTPKTVTTKINGKTLNVPGLNFNIVRYNIGGTGKSGDYPGKLENYKYGHSKTGLQWWKLIQGFMINDKTFDWSRDSHQRNMLAAIVKRGVQYIEFYSAAPMWWMTDSLSSLGGALLPSCKTAYAKYIVEVIFKAVSSWGIPVTSVSILNEPSGDFSKYQLIDHEGMNAPIDLQSSLLSDLRSELDAKSLKSVQTAGSDERTIPLALPNLSKILPLVDKYNIHDYDSSNDHRKTLHDDVKGSKPVWVSAYSDDQTQGIKTASTIVNDLNYLQACGWVYFQALTTDASGLVYASTFGQSQSDPNRAAISGFWPKYYVMAQFSRYIRPGDQILSSNNPDTTVVAYDSAKDVYKFVIVNYLSVPTVTVNLVPLGKVGFAKKVNVRYTAGDGSSLFKLFNVDVIGGVVVFSMEKNSVYSFEI